MSKDTIYRQDAINALWKALYEYEDKTEKRFQESEDLDVRDWIEHRTFVQNMNDIDRQTILNLPSAEPEIIRCKDCKYYNAEERLCNDLMGFGRYWSENDYCSFARRRGEQDDH